MQIAKRFIEAIVPKNPLLYFDLTLFRDWVREFYRLRGDFAHGRIQSRTPRRWESWHHLLFGAIAFPLLTKALLENEKSYVFTENDHCQLAALAWMLREALDASATTKSWSQYVSDQHLLIRRAPLAS